MLKSKKITIFLIEDSGKGMKAVSLPSIFLASVFLCLILSALVVGLIFCDYRISKPKIAELTKAESLCFHQKTQIAYLERRILDIHEKLKELNEYDLKLKNVAHIATGDEGGSLVGVGGSNPGGIGDAMRKTDSGTERQQAGLEQNPASRDPRQEEQGIHHFLQIRNLLASSHCSQWPVKGWVCSPFGIHASALSGAVEFHRGVDIAAKENAPVLAPEDGMITSVDWREGYGRRVVLSHGLGLVSIFSHLDKVFVSKGERLRQGDRVATAGGSGRSSGPYVHYEVQFYGVPVDPQKSLTAFLQ